MAEEVDLEAMEEDQAVVDQVIRDLEEEDHLTQVCQDKKSYLKYLFFSFYTIFLGGGYRPSYYGGGGGFLPIPIFLGGGSYYGSGRSPVYCDGYGQEYGYGYRVYGSGYGYGPCYYD